MEISQTVAAWLPGRWPAGSKPRSLPGRRRRRVRRACKRTNAPGGPDRRRIGPQNPLHQGGCARNTPQITAFPAVEQFLPAENAANCCILKLRHAG